MKSGRLPVIQNDTIRRYFTDGEVGEVGTSLEGAIRCGIRTAHEKIHLATTQLLNNR